MDNHYATRPARQSGWMSWLAFRLGLLIFQLPALAASPNIFDQTVLHPAIPLVDEAGRHVLETGQPYSARMSCGNGAGGGCHDYDSMNHAYHFEQGRDEAVDDYGAKRGLPHLVGPGYFGGYNCMQGNNPASLAKKANASEAEFGDFGAAGYLKACSTCHMGGGWEEYDRNGVRYDQMPDASVAALDGDYFNRDSTGAVVRWDWRKSGVREADCMTCHADLTLLKKFPASQLGGSKDQSDTAMNHWGWLQDQKFVQAGLFRYANSALFEFLNTHPETAEGANLLTVEKQIAPGNPKPDYQLALNAEGLPILHWNRDAFDDSGKVVIPMLRFPASENCMICHLAGAGINRVTAKVKSSRRGFYGIGEDARPVKDEGGKVIFDAGYDIHKGTTWNDDSGETRVIENCSACHDKQYYKPLYANIDLDADHNFPKSNGDADIRNDLDDQPGPLACDYCHSTAQRPALPSGQKTILDAHRERWKTAGFMFGYAPGSLNRVVQVHFDDLECQTCHNHKVEYNGAPIQIHYRYRLNPAGKQKLIPYQPQTRFHVRDKKSGRGLYRYEREAVFRNQTGADGVEYGAIVDPANGQEIGKVGISAGQYDTPASYDDFKALKRAYDNLLRGKGQAEADTAFVYTESNEYIITHQTRQAADAVPCTDCHEKKSNGSINGAVAPKGIMGSARQLDVAKLPDKRLVDEGIVELGMPYYKVDANGRIYEIVGEVMEASKAEGSMSIFKAQTARAISGEFRTLSGDTAAGDAGFSGESAARVAKALGSGQWMLFNSRIGHESLRPFAMILPGSVENRAFLQRLRGEAETREVSEEDVKKLRKLKAGKPLSDIYSMRLWDETKSPVAEFSGGDALVKLPYQGPAQKAKQVKLAYSDDGARWRKVKPRDVVDFQPSSSSAGYVVVQTKKPFTNLVILGKVKKEVEAKDDKKPDKKAGGKSDKKTN